MRDLTVYDSQGEPLDTEGRGNINERIKDFFFGGVRIALETVGNGYKLTAFFRARDSSASRSEQYYGVLETTDEKELSRFSEIIEDHLRTEYGKELVTTKEDTTVFEELSAGTLRSAPGDRETRNDIAKLVNEGEQALVGVGSYEEATTLMTSYLGELKNPRIVIAENAKSSTFSDYGLVIEKGSYTGLELLGDTDDRIEEMKERKRREREQMLGGPGMDPYGQQQQQSGPLGLGLGTRALAGVAVGGVVLLLVLASVGACFLGVSVPVVGGIIPLDCGGGGGGNGGQTQSFQPVSITNATVMQNGSQAAYLHVEGTLQNNESSSPNGNVTVAYKVTESTNGTLIAEDNTTIDVTDGAFTLTPSATNENESYDENESYNVTISWENESHTVTTPFDASEATPTETGTQTPDPTSTATPAQDTSTPTPTPEDTTSGESDDSSGTASFSIIGISAENTTAGEPIEGSFTVSNEGTVNGTANITISASFGDVNESMSVDVDSGNSKPADFSIPTDSTDSGTYYVTASIDGQNEKDEATVTIEPQSSSTSTTESTSFQPRTVSTSEAN